MAHLIDTTVHMLLIANRSQPRVALMSILLVTAGYLSDVAAQTVVAVPDTFLVAPGTTYFSPVSVLSNDRAEPPDSLIATLVATPSTGALEFETDGTFRYESPAVRGPVAFSYAARSLPLQRLPVDSTTSTITLSAELTTPLGSATDSQTIRVGGQMGADLGVDGIRTDSIRIKEVDIRNTVPVDLTFRYGSPVTVATIRVRAAPRALRLALASPGAGSATAGPLGGYAQSDNSVSVQVRGTIKGTGLLEQAVPEDSIALSTDTRVDFRGSLLAGGNDIFLTINVDTENRFDIDGNQVDLTISGTVTGFGPRQQGVFSEAADVILNIASGTATQSNPAPRDNEGLDLYPNPVRADLGVKTDLTGRKDIHIFDAYGRLVATTELHAARTVLDFSPFSAGLYLIRISGRQGMQQGVVIKQ